MSLLNFSIFYHYPLQVLSFFSLLMALISIWIKKSVWIWGSFGVISLIIASNCGMIKPIALLPLFFLTLLVWGLQFDVQGFARFLLVSTAFLTGGALFFSLLPGFISPIAITHPSLCINYGRACVGIILLGTLISTLSTKRSKDWKTVWGCAITSAIGFFLLLLLWETSFWKPYFSLTFFPWAGLVLFFSILPEEALLRGLLQKEITAWLGTGVKAHVFSVGIVTMIYPLFHLSWAGDLSLLLPTFATGLTFACLYQITKMIEVSILCHFLLLSIQFCFFGHFPLWHQLPCMSLGF